MHCFAVVVVAFVRNSISFIETVLSADCIEETDLWTKRMFF